MRKILFIAATLAVAGIAGTSPSLARQDAWCARMPVNGGNPECNFATYRQCQATISGIGGSCIRNPGMAYNRMGGGYNNSGWNNGGYSSGWNSSGSGWNYGNGWDHRNWHGDNRSW
jgi:hypothetical protein